VRLRQLSDLQADIQKRADIQNSTAFIPLSDITEYINQGWTRIYGVLCRTGENYYLANSQITTVSGQASYYTTSATGVPAGTAVLPTNMWDIKGVDVQIQTGRWANAERMQWEQRNDYQPGDFAWPMKPYYDYQNSGVQASVLLMPVPTGGIPVNVWYYPAAVRLSANTDTIDGGNGWEIYAIDWAARRCAEKDENYELCARLDRSLEEMLNDIRAEAASRNAGIAPKVRRVRYKQWGGPGPWRM